MIITTAHIGDSISIKTILKHKRSVISMRSPLIMREYDKDVVVFPYGVVVFWDFSWDEQQKFLASIKSSISNAYANVEYEQEQVNVGESYNIENNMLTIPDLNSKNVAIISMVLARSHALEKHERNINELFELFTNLRNKKSMRFGLNMSNKKLLDILTSTMDVQQNMLASVSMLDTPDVIWDDRVLSDFYKDLLEEYEIELRYQQHIQKLDLLMKQAEFILHIIESRKTFWLEITIIVLIAIEVVIFLYDWLVK